VKIKTQPRGFQDIRESLAIVQNQWNRYGTAVLVGGTVDVELPTVAADTVIQVTRTTLGGTPGHLSLAITAGEKITITSSSGSDTSTVLWRILD
jgi:hypothetical protein